MAYVPQLPYTLICDISIKEVRWDCLVKKLSNLCKSNVETVRAVFMYTRKMPDKVSIETPKLNVDVKNSTKVTLKLEKSCFQCKK